MKTTEDFKWSNLGDIEKGRPNLGDKTSVAVYRIFNYSLKSVLEKHLGKEKTRSFFVEAGHMAGLEYCRNMLATSLTPDRFVAELHRQLKDLGIGVLYVEKADFKKLDFVLTVTEDLDCSGLTPCGETVCTFDEGFIAGILEAYTGKSFEVKEVDCWTTGSTACRFTARAH
ncbi:MAG: 4-vinyl reductase [Candidatus Eremiobacteraeota bacterium]|nr:4-vinyl reductase [Candidatus Eremiobacteraeota bacterium]